MRELVAATVGLLAVGAAGWATTSASEVPHTVVRPAQHSTKPSVQNCAEAVRRLGAGQLTRIVVRHGHRIPCVRPTVKRG